MTTHLDQAQNLIRFVKQTQFNTLYLDSCGIENLNDYPELMECTHLKVLSIRSNQISDISLLSKLNNLVSLKLDNNNISDISCLKELNKLEILKISSNKISDIQSLGELTFLKELDLSFNKINQIDVLENLVRLESLNLSNNKVSDINYLSDLIELKYLNLNTNYISKVPFGVANLDMEINVWDRKNNFEGLNLYKNPLVSPPIEVLQGEKSFIIEWYNAVKGKLNEIKIILIGDPKAGKTSLLRRLKDDQFDDNEVQTDGVNIEDIEFGIAETFLDQDLIHDLTGHFWDFGGQEIMNNTHQFFLTNRSIYMLVLDARNDNNVSDQIRRWLMRIKATSGNSPIIVIANQIDVNSGFGFENEYELQQEFPQIRTFIKVSCKSSENISLLKNQLQYTINRAELIETKIDERWLKLKTELQKVTKQKYFLNETDFLETCKNLNLTLKQDQQNAIKFLNDLGLVLHFENINLSEYYVLDPYWITYGVYQILTSIYANNNNGLISMDKLDYIVNEESEKEKKYITTNHKKIIYSNNQRRFLVDILNQFKLCFYLPDQLNFIIPDLLDTNEPFEITESLRNSENCIRFVYEYNYLPKSIMPYIMVKTHLMIYAKWRTGCVLKYDGFISLISTYQNRITIIVISEDKKKSEFLAVIRHIIDSINSTLIDKPTMLIPLPGTESFVDYEELLYRRKEGEKNTSFINQQE
jgi:small GTP-binding protein